ncbi:MAG TPA: cupin domain-containing protein [bacterium]|nr:cupin domain-containing protein [bacterium]
MSQPRQPSPEKIETLLRRPGVRVERITSHGHRTKEGFWYDQNEDEWVMVLAGAALLRFANEAEARRLGPGDHADIPAHARHRVEWTDPDSDTVWIAVFSS